MCGAGVSEAGAINLSLILFLLLLTWTFKIVYVLLNMIAWLFQAIQVLMQVFMFASLGAVEQHVKQYK